MTEDQAKRGKEILFQLNEIKKYRGLIKEENFHFEFASNYKEFKHSYDNGFIPKEFNHIMIDVLEEIIKELESKLSLI